MTSLNIENLTSNIVTTQILFVGTRKLSMAEDGALLIDGKVQIAGDLKVDGKIFGKELEVEKITIATPAASPDGKNNASVGTGSITAGQTAVVVETTALTASSKVFVTATVPTGGQALVVTEKKAGESFTVTLDHPLSTDIAFDWFIIN